VSFGRRLVIGTGLLGLFAVIVGVAALVYGPGDSLAPEELSAVVLQLEDVPGARQVENCDDEFPTDSQSLPEKTIFVVFRLGEEGSSGASPVCIQAGVRLLDSHALAAAAFQESVDFFPEYEEAVEVPESEGAVDLERIRIAEFGDRSFSYTLGCGRDCTPGDTRSYIIQFQRSNTLSFLIVSGQEKDDLLTDAVAHARKQEDRIDAALESND